MFNWVISVGHNNIGGIREQNKPATSDQVFPNGFAEQISV